MVRKEVAGRIAVAGVVLVGLGSGAWWMGNGVSPAASTATVSAAVQEGEPSGSGEKPVLGFKPSGKSVNADVISTTAEPPATHTETYRNERYGFEYRHTPQARVTEYDEGQGAMTIVHENVEKVRGMQIFILPYAEATISEERFRADVPSGVRENVENTTLDGIPAVTFNSFDLSIGETREIWVIHNGFLYEITTMRGVGQWFSPIIQSWRFTP